MSALATTFNYDRKQTEPVTDDGLAVAYNTARSLLNEFRASSESADDVRWHVLSAAASIFHAEHLRRMRDAA